MRLFSKKDKGKEKEVYTVKNFKKAASRIGSANQRIEQGAREKDGCSCGYSQHALSR
jgi:hypothetical protein